MATWRDEKKRYEQYRVRKEQLPASYLDAIDAVERYALRFGSTRGEAVVTMLEIVGDDPVRFAQDFVQNYPANPWVHQEQQRLASAVTHAGRAEAGQ